MTKHNVFAATVLVTALLASNAFAADAMPQSREQVRAAYLQAQAQGTLAPRGEAMGIEWTNSPSTLSRNEVKAAYFSALKNGTLTKTGEASDAFVLPVSTGATRDRAEVRAEAVIAAKTRRPGDWAIRNTL